MIRRALFAGVLLGMMGCATGRPPAPDAPETVGALSASYRSIAVVPIHATTDLAPSFGAVEGDDTATSEVTTVSRAPDAGEPDALPGVAPKTDGVTVGGAR